MPCPPPDFAYLSFMDAEVLYNGKCPICAAEIAHYQRYATTRALPLRFVDLHDTDLTAWTLTEAQAGRRLHVRRGGQLYSGVDAFIELWSELPRYAWIARLVALPGLRQVCGWGYNHVLAPALYRAHLRRQRRALT